MHHKMERQVQQEACAEKVPPELRPLWQVYGQEQQVPNQMEEQVLEEEDKRTMPTDLWSVLQQRL
jgi:hypothetical protein